MADKPEFDPRYGEAVVLSDKPLVRRITAPNSGPYTFTGTNTFLVGRKHVCVIDPGPWNAGHMDLIIEEAEKTGLVSHILLTHTHIDHTEAVRELARRTGAKVFGFGPHQVESMGGDMEIDPDVRLEDGDELSGDDWALTAIYTPGHCQTHLCFALNDTDILFAGDHVMGWSSSVIIPPDGDLGDYFDSLTKLANIPQNFYLSGHGGEIENGKTLAAAMSKHRHMRNAQILDKLTEPLTLEQIVSGVYPKLAANLIGAATATVGAHLIYLGNQGSVQFIRNSAGTPVYSRT